MTQRYLALLATLTPAGALLAFPLGPVYATTLTLLFAAQAALIYEITNET